MTEFIINIRQLTTPINFTTFIYISGAILYNATEKL